MCHLKPEHLLRSSLRRPRSLLEVHYPDLDLDYRSIITIQPGKRSGKPCIRGLRITVYDVLGMLAAGMSHTEILADFPYLTEEDIKACLAYAADSDRRLLIVGS